MRKLALVAIGWIFAIASWAQAPTTPTYSNALQAIPTLTSRVIDQTQTLSNDEVSSLQAQLKSIEDQRGTQIVVLMIASTQPEDIFSYSNRVANAWKIGRKDVGDGVLIVVAKADRKLRIEIAKSLEGAIPDLAASDIITTAITPAFKQGQYGQGLQAGIALLDKRLAGDTSLAAPSDAASVLSTFEPNLFGLIALIVIFLFAVRFFGFGNTMLVLMSMSRGGGGGYSSGGGGSGGFSSGGGGNFGGGGASGDW
jgi:uncharacterized protein